MAKTLIALLMMVLCAIPQAAWAGGCGHYTPIIQQVIQPIYQPFAIYQVGQDLEIKAAVEKAMRARDLAEYQQKQALIRQNQQQEWTAQQPAPYNHGQQVYQHQQQPPPQQQVTTTQPPLVGRGQGQLTALTKHCGRCHATENSSAGYKWSFDRPTTSLQKLAIFDWVANPTAPKTQDIPLPPQMAGVLSAIPLQEKGAILDEVLSLPLSREGGDPAQVTAPPPPQSARSSFGGF